MSSWVWETDCERRERVLAALGAWMQAASWGVISFFTLSRSMGNIFCTKASSCCLNSRAGYLASTYKIHFLDAVLLTVSLSSVGAPQRLHPIVAANGHLNIFQLLRR